MKKLHWITMFMLGTMLFSACTTASPAAPTASPTAQAEIVVEPTATTTVAPTITSLPEENIPTPSDTESEDAMPAELPQPINIADRLLLDFEVVFYQSDFESETAPLSSVFENGKPTVLVFWAGLCPVCRREMPEIQAAYEQYGDRANFIGIDVGMYTNLGSQKDALALIDEFNLTYAMGATMDYQVMSTYEVTAIPTVLFMKPDGQILRKESTLLSQDAIFERIDTLLEFSEL